MSSGRIISHFTLLVLLLVFTIATEAFATPKGTPATVDSLYSQAFQLSEENKLEESETLIREGLRLSRQLQDSGRLAKGYTDLAEIYFFKKDLKHSEEYAMQARAYCGEKCGPKLLIKVAAVLGGLYSFQGLHHKSLMNYQEALETSKAEGHDDTYINVLFNMCGTLGDLGRYEEMLSGLIQCKEYYENTGNTSKLATIHNNLGLAYQERFQEPAKALDHYRKAIALSKSANDEWKLARNYNNISLAFLDLKDYDSANYYLSEAIELKKGQGDEGSLAIFYHAMGELLLRTDRFAEAEDYYRKSKGIAEKYGIKEGQYYNSLGLGLAGDSLGKADEALRHYEKAFEFAKASGNIDFLKTSKEHLYRHHKMRGRPEQALAAFEEAQTYKDSLQALQGDEKFLDLKAKYEEELHEKENALLRAEQQRQQSVMEKDHLLRNIFMGIAIVSLMIVVILFIAYRSRNTAYRLARTQKVKLEEMNTSLQSKTSELNDINNSKDRLFSVISHDLRGPLASLEGYLNLLVTAPLEEGERNELMNDLRVETHNTLKALDDLLAWSKIQMGGETARKHTFDLGMVIKEVWELYRPMAKHKAIEVDLETPPGKNLVFADSFQIRTVVRNLLSNAIKFTPEGSRICIKVEKDGTELSVSVADEGKGISEAEMEKVKDNKQYYSSRGTNGEIGSGLGLLLSLEYLNQNDSRLVFKKNEPKGTIASFSLKAP